MGKPANWDDLSLEDRCTLARDLFNSLRGSLIVGQALAEAVNRLRENPYHETSNIEDMEMLGETLFAPWFPMFTKLKKPVIKGAA